MSSLNHNVQRHFGIEPVSRAGSFQTNGSSAPTATSGTGWSAERTGAGQYTVTMDPKVPAHTAVVAGLELADDTYPGDAVVTVNVGAVDMRAGTFKLTTYSGTSAHDFEASENLRVNFHVQARRSSDDL